MLITSASQRTQIIQVLDIACHFLYQGKETFARETLTGLPKPLRQRFYVLENQGIPLLTAISHLWKMLAPIRPTVLYKMFQFPTNHGVGRHLLSFLDAQSLARAATISKGFTAQANPIQPLILTLSLRQYLEGIRHIYDGRIQGQFKGLSGKFHFYTFYNKVSKCAPIVQKQVGDLLSKAFPSLQSLEALGSAVSSNAQNGIKRLNKDEQLKALSTFLQHTSPNLREFGFASSTIAFLSDEAIADFALSHPKIESLTIQGCPSITGSCLKEIATSCTNIRNLCFWGCSISDIHLQYLTQCPHLGTLSFSNSFGLAANKALEPIGQCTQLRRLCLAGGLITDQGLKHLYPCKTLRHIDLSNTQVTQQGIAALRKAIPHLETCNFRNYGRDARFR